jgi:hypothetical protein
MRLMADWLIHLLIQIGGVGAVFAIVKFLLKPIWTTLNGYATAYLNGQAAIDVRIRNLEKLAEEQARLTRTVESIKDEIAAERKSHDNRWAFRKDVYVNIINATTEMIDFFVGQLSTAEFNKRPDSLTVEDRAKLLEWQELKMKQFYSAVKTFSTYSNLAPLATADSVMAALAQTNTDLLRQIDFTSQDCEAEAKVLEAKLALERLLMELCSSGRKDLWGTPDAEAKAAVKS